MVYLPKLNVKNTIYNEFVLFTILLSLAISVESACFTNPISISNISYCENSNCYYTQFTSGTSDIKVGNTICYEYSDSILTDTINYVNFTFGDATASFGYNDCYYTDDFVGISNCHCNCPLSFNDPDVCPCPNAVHYDNFESICKSGQVAASGCPLGRLTDACCNIHFSAYSRYQVCSISKFPTYIINLHVDIGIDSGCDFVINNNQQRLQCKNINFTVSNININSMETPNFRILDVLTGKSYFSSSPRINQKNEKDPNKFGAITVNSDNTLNIPNNYPNFIDIQSSDCLSDNIILTLPTPQFSDLVTSNVRSVDAPILRSGLLFIDLDDEILYLGRDFNNKIVMGPKMNVMLIHESKLFFSLNSPTQPCSESGHDDITTFLPNTPQNKTYFLKSWSSLIEETQSAPTFVLIEFSPSVKFLMKMVPHNAGGFTLFGCNDNVQNYNLQLSVLSYPDRENVVINLVDTILERPLSNNQISRAITPPSYDKEIDSGSLIYSFYYNGVNLKVHNTRVKITVTEVFLDTNTISFNSFIDQDNIICQATTTPQVTDSKSFKLSKVPVLTGLNVHDITYKGSVNLTINCGLDSLVKTLQVDLQAKPENKLPEQLLLTNWDNNKWYIKYIKIGAIILPTLIGAIIIFKIISCFYKRKPKVEQRFRYARRN